MSGLEKPKEAPEFGKELKKGIEARTHLIRRRVGKWACLREKVKIQFPEGS